MEHMSPVWDIFQVICLRRSNKRINVNVGKARSILNNFLQKVYIPTL